ncbi:WbuC family cupin fold metalloprotein [Pseudodesulfovibrio sp. zrk46]|uniref:WbuC family cupin fold metalloprotein n=1 Tax=Pseudodesulfovibrio sp. zrk46 TaxID=2725288 RepID=UPI001449A881|nr:WbuC family cupin fold metalloprotein [Pseudodesulfovibrio sp. zrk46]QJB55620.1 WbuC family cupin fold metalloprotein [Pseudodesulfovibrio sp. zrk46]
MTEENTEFPMAVDAPAEDVSPLTLTMVSELLALSRQSPRKRMIQRLHKNDDDGVHRMFNALQPGTYITPHRHMDPPKSETIVVISGSLLFVEFDDEGVYRTHTLLQPGTENFGVDVAPHVFHTFIVLKPDTLIFEIKDGPYAQATDKDIPAWAPKEGSPEAEPYLLDLIKHLAELANAAAEKAKAEEAEAAAANAEETAQEEGDEGASGSGSPSVN